MMPNVTDRELILEATQTYFTLPPSVLPRRIKKLSPDAKIVVVLCNPADRVMIDFNIEVSYKRRKSRTRSVMEYVYSVVVVVVMFSDNFHFYFLGKTNYCLQFGF